MVKQGTNTALFAVGRGPKTGPGPASRQGFNLTVLRDQVLLKECDIISRNEIKNYIGFPIKAPGV